MDKIYKKLKIDIEYDILLKNKIPLLIENNEWIELFDNGKDKDLIKEKQMLKNIVNDEKQKILELENKKNQKKRLMAKIITLSDEINNNNKIENISLLEETERDLNQINEDIEDLTYALELLPRKIRESNLKLLETTVRHAYLELMKKEEDLDKVNMELVELREQLRNYIVLKCDHEERINKLYSFLHNSLGNEKINELDRDILD